MVLLIFDNSMLTIQMMIIMFFGWLKSPWLVARITMNVN